MRLIRCFSHVRQGFITHTQILKALSIFLISLSFYAHQADAYQLELEIFESKGGKISSVENNFGCMEHCKIQTFSKRIISLLALADDGYRFDGWEGACDNSLGPLCTLKLNENGKVSAKFVKSEQATPPVQAILLLHDINEKHTVWNEFVKQRFNNRCPVVYGGFVLDKDSFDTSNRTACYRIAFGYYGLIRDSLVDKDYLANSRPHYSKTHLGFEIRAAVLGLLNRHPNLNLTLIGNGHAAIPALSYLQTTTEDRKNINGLLSLSSEGRITDKNIFSAMRADSEFKEFPLVRIAAHPAQSRKINAALDTLVNAKWPLN
ncbi:MAG: hypothetical protein IPN42_13430 [Methylococcaceae bacterium]|nr:hypothetical protein [Methylococcaceae bacterium]